jgi:hypothetical protein
MGSGCFYCRWQYYHRGEAMKNWTIKLSHDEVVGAIKAQVEPVVPEGHQIKSIEIKLPCTQDQDSGVYDIEAEIAIEKKDDLCKSDK